MKAESVFAAELEEEFPSYDSPSLSTQKVSHRAGLIYGSIGISTLKKSGFYVFLLSNNIKGAIDIFFFSYKFEAPEIPNQGSEVINPSFINILCFHALSPTIFQAVSSSFVSS